jgi:hypothetical protein
MFDKLMVTFIPAGLTSAVLTILWDAANGMNPLHPKIFLGGLAFSFVSALVWFIKTVWTDKDLW